jgi:hypothetical protein
MIWEVVHGAEGVSGGRRRGGAAAREQRPSIAVIAAAGLPIEVACRVLGASCAGLRRVTREVHAPSSGTYGAKRVHAELVLGRGSW